MPTWMIFLSSFHDSTHLELTPLSFLRECRGFSTFVYGDLSSGKVRILHPRRTAQDTEVSCPIAAGLLFNEKLVLPSTHLHAGFLPTARFLVREVSSFCTSASVSSRTSSDFVECGGFSTAASRGAEITEQFLTCTRLACQTDVNLQAPSPCAMSDPVANSE